MDFNETKHVKTLINKFEQPSSTDSQIVLKKSGNDSPISSEISKELRIIEEDINRYETYDKDKQIYFNSKLINLLTKLVKNEDEDSKRTISLIHRLFNEVNNKLPKLRAQISYVPYFEEETTHHQPLFRSNLRKRQDSQIYSDDGSSEEVNVSRLSRLFEKIKSRRSSGLNLIPELDNMSRSKSTPNLGASKIGRTSFKSESTANINKIEDSNKDVVEGPVLSVSKLSQVFEQMAKKNGITTTIRKSFTRQSSVPPMSSITKSYEEQKGGEEVKEHRPIFTVDQDEDEEEKEAEEESDTLLEKVDNLVKYFEQYDTKDQKEKPKVKKPSDEETPKEKFKIFKNPYRPPENFTVNEDKPGSIVDKLRYFEYGAPATFTSNLNEEINEESNKNEAREEIDFQKIDDNNNNSNIFDGYVKYSDLLKTSSPIIEKEETWTEEQPDEDNGSSMTNSSYLDAISEADTLDINDYPSF